MFCASLKCVYRYEVQKGDYIVCTTQKEVGWDGIYIFNEMQAALVTAGRVGDDDSEARNIVGTWNFIKMKGDDGRWIVKVYNKKLL